MVSGAGFREMPGEILLQFDHGHAAFPLAVAAKAEALDHAVSAQMLVDGRAQCTGAVAMDQIDHGLAVQDGAVDEGIHLRQCLIDRQAQQIALHFGAALHPLYPAVRAVGVTGQAGIPLLRLGLGLRFLDQLFGLLQAQERNFGLDDSGANEDIAVFIRQSQHRCQLIQLGDADLLPHLDLLQRN